MGAVRARRTAGWVIAALLPAAALLVLPASPARAGAVPISSCTPTSGVVLAVDFGHWGGPVLRACGSTPTTGYQLLNQGGWRSTGTQHDGPGFVCRIGYGGFRSGTAYPTAAEDACVMTPPATAYWSYWHADPGQSSWHYSQVGAVSYHPVPGSVELWTFGATDVGGTTGTPSIPVSSVRAQPAPAPTAAPTRSTTPAPSRTTATAGASRPAQAGAAASSATSSLAATGSATTGAPSPSSTSAQSGPSGGPAVADAAAPTTPVGHEAAGSPAPLVVAVLLILALVGLGAWARRRRSRAP
jgi:hypothetical protein